MQRSAAGKELRASERGKRWDRLLGQDECCDLLRGKREIYIFKARHRRNIGTKERYIEKGNKISLKIRGISKYFPDRTESHEIYRNCEFKTKEVDLNKKKI